MGTPSTIAILKKNGTVEQINAYYDGFITSTGVTLLCFYNDINKVKELISLGDLSGLNKEIHPPIGVTHNFGNPADDVTIFYGRDRGESGNKANKYPSYEDYVKLGVQEPFNYLFDEKKNKWFFLDPYECKLDEINMTSKVAKQSLATVVKSNKDNLNSINEKYYETYLKNLKIERDYKKMQKELPNQEVTIKKMKI